MPAVLAGVTIVFYAKILFTNHYMFRWDAVDFFYPYLSFVHEELRHLRLPTWDPYVMSGFPIIGDPEAQIFYPLNWLMVLVHPFSYLPFKLVEIQLIVHFFLAGLFMYYLARSFVQSTAPALLAAVLFEFSGAMVIHTQHVASIESVAWYPLIFLLARRGLLEGRLFLTVSAGMVFGIQLLVGHLQHSVYMGVLLFLYFAYEACFGPMRAKLWPRWMVGLAIIACIGAALAMVQLIPTHELGSLSARTRLTFYDVAQGNEPRFLWTLFLPNYFGGLNGAPQWYQWDLSFNYVYLTVPGCLLALLGMIETVRRRNFFWLGLVLLCGTLSIGYYGPLGKLVYHIPILNLFRNIPTFFDLANLALCLLAGMGAETLFSKTLAQPLRRYLVHGLTVLLIVAATLGLVLRFGEHVRSWYAMLAVLAIFIAVVDAILREKLGRTGAQLAVFLLLALQLVRYNWNQEFNWQAEDPRRYTSHEYALNSKGVLQFLRSDSSSDFRIAALAEYPWSGNGPNVWRIPSIYGWNPITLHRYEQYVRGFTNTGSSTFYTLPYGGPDNNLNSSMLDLLGVKYVVINDIDMEKSLHLTESEKFQFIDTGEKWWRTYRNRNYLSRAWFFSEAAIVPSESVAFALMSSNWFDGRRTLLFEQGALPAPAAALAKPVATITLSPSQVSAASSGYPMAEPYCSEPIPMYANWAEKKDDWIRYEFQGPAEPGRYLLLVSYAAARRPTPVLDVEIRNGEHSERSDPVTLPGTVEWSCARSRTTELGTFDIGPGLNRLTMNSRIPSDIHLFTLLLVRLPQSEAAPGAFAFRDFSVAANRISFHSQQDRDGFVLLNEIHYPGWEATLDGAPVAIHQADGVFRTLFVPAGTHSIEMKFRPTHFWLGAGVSLLTLFGYLIYAVRIRRRV